MNDNLIKKLQAITDESDECYTTDLCHEAADALKAMQTANTGMWKENERLKDINYELQFGMGLRDKRIADLESALREIAGTDDYSPAVDCVFIAKQALKERDDE